MNAWTVAKGILLAALILTGVSWLFMAGVLSVGTKAISHAVDQNTEKNRLRPEQRKDEIRRSRLSTAKGKDLWTQCRDWRNADADYHLPSTRQGVEKYCGELERYLNAP